MSHRFDGSLECRHQYVHRRLPSNICCQASEHPCGLAVAIDFPSLSTSLHPRDYQLFAACLDMPASDGMVLPSSSGVVHLLTTVDDIGQRLVHRSSVTDLDMGRIPAFDDGFDVPAHQFSQDRGTFFGHPPLAKSFHALALFVIQRNRNAIGHPTPYILHHRQSDPVIGDCQVVYFVGYLNGFDDRLLEKVALGFPACSKTAYDPRAARRGVVHRAEFGCDLRYASFG